MREDNDDNGGLLVVDHGHIGNDTNLGGNEPFYEDEEDEEEEDDEELVPSFKWDENHRNNNNAWLHIKFPDGALDDIAILKAYNPIPDAPDDKDQEDPDECIFKGKLKRERLATVSLNGCPGSETFDVKKDQTFKLFFSKTLFQVSITSDRLKHHAYAVKDGQVKAYKNSKAKLMANMDYGNYGDSARDTDDQLEAFINSQSTENDIEGRSSMPNRMEYLIFICLSKTLFM